MDTKNSLTNGPLVWHDYHNSCNVQDIAPIFLKERGCRQIQKKVYSSLMSLWPLPMRVVLLALVLVAFCSVFPFFIFVPSFSEWCGDNTRGPPVWGPAQHCRRVPSQPVLHTSLPWSQGQPGPSGWVGWGGAVLDQRHEEADREPGEHGRARAIGPVSFTLSLKICYRLVADLLSPQNHRWVLMCPFRNILHLTSTCLYVSIRSQRYVIKNSMILLQTS